MSGGRFMQFGQLLVIGAKDVLRQLNFRLSAQGRENYRLPVSIVTKGGDRGSTGLMYNRRVSKCHPRVEAYGAADELNAALGMAKATAEDNSVRTKLELVQGNLVTLMGELATAVEDLPRYASDGYSLVTTDLTKRLESWIAEIEAQNITYKGWATPGSNVHSAALDVARTVCRRVERRVCALQEANQLQNTEIIVYLNRLADLLWLLARWSEQRLAE